MINAMKAYGKKFGRTVILPPTSQDYSPQVAQATGGGADCVVMIVSETPYVAWNQAYLQSGTKARMYGPQGNLDSVSIKGLGSKLDGSIIAGMYPDISTAPWLITVKRSRTRTRTPAWTTTASAGSAPGPLIRG